MNLPTNSIKLSGEMWGITTYYNPAGYANKLQHLEIFSRRVRAQGLRLLVIELTPPPPHSLEIVGQNLADCVIRVQSASVMWQKERLLNIGIRHLPDACDKVAWLDGDVLFQNPNWVGRTAKLLEDYVAVQPFQRAFWLPPGIEQIDLKSASLNSDWKWRYSTAYDQALHPGNNLAEGHMGFAWAARRSALAAADGLYDRFIIGGGDTVMIAAMYGITDTSATRWWIEKHCTPAQTLHVLSWARAFHDAVKGSVSYVPGAVFHLWHGNRMDRKYDSRHRVLKDNDFDPIADLTLNADSCWTWNSDKPDLHSRVARYFEDRNEDGRSREEAGRRIALR